jgi:hypothetical protein
MVEIVVVLAWEERRRATDLWLLATKWMNDLNLSVLPLLIVSGSPLALFYVVVVLT